MRGKIFSSNGVYIKISYTFAETFKLTNNKQEMKKLVTLVAVAGMFTFYACGPSAEEKAAMEKAKQDSIAMAETAMAEAEAAKAQAMQDSIAKVQAEAAKAQAMQDSMAKAAEMMKGKGKKK